MPDVYPGQERWTAPVAETPLKAVDAVDTDTAPESQWKEAWKRLRKNPLFWVSSFLLALLAVVIAVPSLFTSADPTFCTLSDSLASARSGHPFGFDKQGCDVWARTVHGARASVFVGVLTTLLVAAIGIVTGAIAGFYGTFVDSLISRVGDIFFAIPLLLAAIVVLSIVNNLYPERGFWGGCLAIVGVLGLFAWPQLTRQMRASVLQIKHLEYVDAAKAIGATPRVNLVRHIVPNALAPVIVTAMITLGVFITTEATLSFLGLGLPSSIVSWGNDIAAAQNLVRAGDNLSVMFVPAGALALTVLAFILLGDAVRDALDPKAGKS